MTLSDLARGRAIERVSGCVVPFVLRQETRRIGVDQSVLQLRYRHDVAIGDDQLDVVDRDAFGREAVVDHLLVEARRMLLSRDAFLGDRKRNGAVAQQAGAHVMIVGVQAEDVCVFFGHDVS